MKNRIDLSRRTFLKTTSILAGTAALSGFLPLRSFAAAEKELVILAWAGHAEPDIVADFERKYGVKVRAKYYTGGDNMLGLISQSPPGTFDLILSDAEYVQQLNAAEYIEQLDPADYPFDDFYPEFQHFPGHWQGDKLYSVLIRFGFLGIAYNTQLVPEAKVRSYDVFWDESLKGKVGHFDWHLPNLGQISLLNGNARPYDIDAAHWQTRAAEDDEPAPADRRLLRLRRNLFFAEKRSDPCHVRHRRLDYRCLAARRRTGENRAAEGGRVAMDGVLLHRQKSP